ncbi:MAG: hypothetical protein ABI581_04845 [Sediminibacterium sp.]
MFSMFSRKYFSLKKWAFLSLFFFSISFLFAYLTGLTGESKHFLVGNSSLIRRGVTALVFGLLISFMRGGDEE